MAPLGADTSKSNGHVVASPTNLKQLSAHLGLSQTTVSRALNGFPEVSEKTRQRVFEAAKHYNYSPDSKAKRLATGRSMTIGHLVPISNEHEMVNPVFADFISGASARYAESGYDLLLSLVADHEEISAYTRMASRSNVDGVVVHAPKINDHRIKLLNSLDLPFVVHGRSSGVKEDYNWVDVNNERSFFAATEHLINLGHRQLALINGLPDMDFAMRRSAGFQRALNAHGIAANDFTITSGEMTEPYGYESTQLLLQSDTPPTAILASSIIVANGVRRAITNAGLTLGQDISVLAHDDDLSYFRNDGDTPEFTVIRSSVREAGRLTADLLLSSIENQNTEKKGILLEAEFVQGNST